MICTMPPSATSTHFLNISRDHDHFSGQPMSVPYYPLVKKFILPTYLNPQLEAISSCPVNAMSKIHFFFCIICGLNTN